MTAPPPKPNIKVGDVISVLGTGTRKKSGNPHFHLLVMDVQDRWLVVAAVTNADHFKDEEKLRVSKELPGLRHDSFLVYHFARGLPKGQAAAYVVDNPDRHHPANDYSIAIAAQAEAGLCASKTMAPFVETFLKKLPETPPRKWKKRAP